MAKERILVVDDEYLIRWSLQQELAKDGYEVWVAEDGESALRLVRETPPDLVLLDIQLPGMGGIEVLQKIKAAEPEVVVIMITAYGMVDTAVQAMRAGAYDYLNKPFNLEGVKLSIRKGLEASRLRGEVQRLRQEQQARFSLDRVVAESAAMRAVLEMVSRVASSGASTVLLQGESGTGKDLVAKALHYTGARAERPFMAINCASLPEQLLESEVFGHERGAYTDAKGAKKGLFELADGGTVFLDEIGEMRLDLQAKLLRAIEEKSFRRIGGVKDIQVDVRVIAASNKDLDAERRAGRFREDLFYRLNVVPIRLPPLRERPDDILPLAAYYMRVFNREFAKQVTGLAPAAEAALLRYRWPGNVRELKNVLERAILLHAGTVVEAADLPPEILGPVAPAVAAPPAASPAAGEAHGAAPADASAAAPGTLGIVIPPGGLSLDRLEDDLVRQALEQTRGNQTKASQLLGISRDSLRYRMKKMGLIGGEES
ncbi:MAG TPA: sigma-54 dependent transcriptional regulator [bacterium]